jgi:NOL1/NOP2/sun family putative RNA methylase
MSDDRGMQKEKIKSTMIKDSYKQHYIRLLGSEEAYDAFIDAALEFPRRAIRVNTLKISVNDLKIRLEKKGWQLERVPWCDEGFFIERGDRRDIGNLAEHALGYFYVQEPSSMIPPIMLDPREGELVLDIAAAPGSKTTQMAAMMKNKGIIIANEIDYSRIIALKSNIERLGVSNCVITNRDARHITLKGFDRILIDAPCSGTGTLSKSLKSLEMWNLRGLQKLSRLQLSLLDHAYTLLRNGGRLVYSTCSLEVEENENVLHRFFERHNDAIAIAPPLSFDSPIISYDGKEFDRRVGSSIRLWPQTCRTDGFFVAIIEKPQSHQ